MTFRKFTSIAVRTLVIPIILITILIGILMYADVSVPLERVRKAVVTEMSEMTGRQVRIDGEVRLAISFFPTLVVDQLHIANDEDWKADDLVSVGVARVQIALLPILSGQLEFTEVAAENLVLNLQQDAEGRTSWGLAKAGDEAGADAAIDADSESQLMGSGDKFTIEEFSLTDVTINYYDEKLGREFTDRIDHLQIDVHDRSRLTASMSGITEGTTYSFSASHNLVNTAPWRIEAQGQVGGHPVTVTTSIDITHGVVDGQIELIAHDVHVGKVLHWLGITEEVDLFSKGLHIKADLHGSSLNELVHQSTFSVELTDGFLNLHSHVDDKVTAVSFESSTLESIKSQDLEIIFSGKIDQEPADVVFSTNPLASFVMGADTVKLELAAKLAYGEFNLHGDVKLPVSTKILSIDLAVKGERLDQWNKLLASKLPPLGPYSMTGKFDMNPTGFQLSNFRAVVGQSDLSGTIDVDITKQRPVWKMQLVSERFQIDDFDVEGYSLIPGDENNDVDTESSATQITIDMLAEADRSLLEPHYIDDLDIDITLEARHVLSGNDRLGHGQLEMKARKDILDIEKLHLNLPGGKIDAVMNIEVVSDGVKGHIKLDMDKFDYGILVRRIDPDSVADGLISTHVDLQLAGKDFSHSLDKATGQIDFAGWPGNISADALNMWSVNLFLAILPSLSDKESKVNCLVAILDTEEGQLDELLLGVDTTKVWVNGNLDVSFPNETVKLRLFPTTKKAKLFGLQTPIQVNGNFDDLSLSVKPVDLIGTYVSLILSPLYAPMSRIFGDKIPENDSEICGQLLNRDYLQSLKDQMQKKDDFLDNAYSGD